MSQQSQNSAQANSSLSPETINALTEKFQEFTRALLALNREERPEPSPREAPKPPKEPDQIRCYRVPGFIVRYEREALKEHCAENLLDMLRKARDAFYLTSTLLQNFHEENEINGFIVQQIGESLAYPLRMLSDLCGIFGDYKPQTTNPDC